MHFVELKLKYLQSVFLEISRVIYSANHVIQNQLSSSYNTGSKIHREKSLKVLLSAVTVYGIFLSVPKSTLVITNSSHFKNVI